MEQEKTLVGEMTKENAQELVLGRANDLFKQMDEKYRRSTDFGEVMSGEQRYGYYEKIATLVIGRDLPQAEVDGLIGKILRYEWWWKGRKVMSNFLEEKDLGELAQTWGPGNSSEVFDKVLMLFPQSEVVIKKYFSPIVDYYNKTGECHIHYKPWLLRDLFLVDAVNFKKEEKQVIAKSWLADYFIHGDEMVEDVFHHTFGDEEKNEENHAISLMMKDFGIEAEQAKDVAQSVIRQFSNGWFMLPDIENFMENVELFVKAKELNWSGFSEKNLVDIFNYSRKVARSWLLNPQKPEESRFIRDESRMNIIFSLTRTWWKEGHKRDWNKFYDHINKMTEADFFQELDSHLSDDAKKLGQRVKMDKQKVDDAFKQIKSSGELTEEIRRPIKVKRKKEEEAEWEKREKEIKEREVRYEKSLNCALEMLQEPGVQPE